MKYRIMAIATGIVLVIALCLLLPVSRNKDFEGEWYAAGEEEPYVFQDGIIECQTHFYMKNQGDFISGAYTYAANKVELFACGLDSLEDVQELYLIRSHGSEILNDAPDGSGRTYFYRDQAAAASRVD